MENKSEQELKQIAELKKNKAIYDLFKNKNQLLNEIEKKNNFIENKSLDLRKFILKNSKEYSEYQLELLSFEELVELKKEIKENKENFIKKLFKFLY